MQTLPHSPSVGGWPTLLLAGGNLQVTNSNSGLRIRDMVVPFGLTGFSLQLVAVYGRAVYRPALAEMSWKYQCIRYLRVLFVETGHIGTTS